jgi:hypothetical protein
MIQKLTVHLQPDQPVKAKAAVVNGILHLMETDRTIPGEVAKTHFFYLLPAMHDELVPICIKAIDYLFRYALASTTKHVVGVLSALLQKDPETTLVTFQAFCRGFDQVRDCWEVADLLIQVKDIVRDSPAGSVLLSLLYQLMAGSAVYLQERGKYAIAVFADYLRSRIPGTIVSAYNGLAIFAALKLSYTADECNVIIEHMKSGLLWPYATSVLARLSDFPITPAIVYSIIVRAPESRIATIALLRLANSKEGAEVLVKYTDWFSAAGLFLEEVHRIVIVLYHDRANRAALAADADFAPLLQSFISSGNAFLVQSVIVLLGMTVIDAEFGARLRKAGMGIALKRLSVDPQIGRQASQVLIQMGG